MLKEQGASLAKFAVPNGVTDPELQSLSSFGSGFLASLMLRGAQVVQKLAKPTQGQCQPWTLKLPGRALWAPWELVLVPTILQIRSILAILQSCSCPILQSSRFSCHFLNLFIQSFQILQSCNPPNIQSSKLGAAECA